MKTIEQIKAEYHSDTIDGRDLYRLSKFLSVDDCKAMELKFTTEEAEKNHVPKPFTRENILEQLKKDVAFGFEKALNQRGISSGLMVEVVMMWNWVLEEGLETLDTDTQYAQYGLPIFKATAIKYGFDNPIGEDVGNEEKYADY